MEIDLPDSLAKTADGKEFIILHDWTNEMQLEAITVLLSDDRVEVIRKAPIWMLDRMYSTSPVPFYQVLCVQLIKQIVTVLFLIQNIKCK